MNLSPLVMMKVAMMDMVLEDVNFNPALYPPHFQHMYQVLKDMETGTWKSWDEIHGTTMHYSPTFRERLALYMREYPDYNYEDFYGRVWTMPSSRRAFFEERYGKDVLEYVDWNG